MNAEQLTAKTGLTYAFCVMVGMARRAIPAREVAGGTNVQATPACEGVAPLRAARTSQRDVPTRLNTYIRSARLHRLQGRADSLRFGMVGMARRAVPAREVAGGTNIRATPAGEGVAPLHAARTSQRDVPIRLYAYTRCARLHRLEAWADSLRFGMVGMARRAVPAREVAGGTNIRATLACEGVAPLHAARTSQRDVPTTLNTY